MNRARSVIPARPETATHATVDQYGDMRLYVSEQEAREHSVWLGIDSEIIPVKPVNFNAVHISRLIGQSFLFGPKGQWFARQ